ncbi:MAG: hypothetical protein ACRDSE_15675 [Pseudonocardiaceae bacterium]
MAVTTEIMTDEQRKSVALEYLKAFDNGRWCDVFEIRDWRIQRCFIYLDPDYAGKDTSRYAWLAQR